MHPRHVRTLLLLPIAMGAGYWLGATTRDPDSRVAPDPAKVERISLVSKPTATSPETLPARLKAAHDPRSNFRAACQTLALIDSLTAADFRAIEADLALITCPAEGPFDDDYGSAYYEAVIARWLAIEPEAETRILKLKEAWPSGFGEGFARLRPVAILDACEGDGFYPGVKTALRTLARQNLPEAQRRLHGFSDKVYSLEETVNEAIADADPVAGIQIAIREKDILLFRYTLRAAARSGRETLRQVLTAGAGKIPASNVPVDLFLQFPGAEWGALASDEPLDTLNVSPGQLARARRMPAAERFRALEENEQLAGQGREVVAVTHLRAWALEDPVSAAKWVAEHPGDGTAQRNHAGRLETVYSIWSETDPAMAMAWVKDQPPSPAKSKVSNIAARELVKGGRIDEAATWLDPNDPIPDFFNWALGAVARAAAEHDPAGALRWYNSLPEAEWKRDALPSIVGEWVERDPDAVVGWIKFLPSGADRDEVCWSMAWRCTYPSVDFATAARWVEMIDDPKKRSKSAERVFRFSSSADPEAARAWFRSVPGLEPGFVDRYFRLMY